MKPQEPQIIFPKDPVEELHKKFDKFFWIVFSVGFVFVVTLIVMVVSLLIDSFHFNSATYKEYSEKTESVTHTQEINQELLVQNKQNQELILKQQNQILELLKQK